MEVKDMIRLVKNIVMPIRIFVCIDIFDLQSETKLRSVIAHIAKACI